MRIGTWNLDANWSAAHEALLTRDFCGARCDVWLLTEVNPKAKVHDANETIAGYQCHLSKGVMARGQHWAAILSKQPIIRLPDPHEASAAALINGITYCSMILPWSGCTAFPPTPWVGTTLGDMARPAIHQLKTLLPKSKTVWGGDWNQNLAGGWQNVGSSSMRGLIDCARSLLGLKVPTAELLFQSSESRNTIDHIAVPTQWNVRNAARISAVGLSDHDAYIIDVDAA